MAKKPEFNVALTVPKFVLYKVIKATEEFKAKVGNLQPGQNTVQLMKTAPFVVGDKKMFVSFNHAYRSP
jgi:hypothetical protein